MPTEYVPGLEGVTAAETEISEVDGQNGRLIYRGGYLIEQLKDCTFEEVAYLLWYGHLPSEQEQRQLRDQLAGNRAMNEPARTALRGIPKDADPMDALRTALSAQGAGPGVPKPTLEEAIAYTAVTPTIIAAFYRQSQGQEWVEPKAELGFAANFLYMLNGAEPDADHVRWLETYLVLLADHGLNASTFAARVIASTGADLCSALVGAIGALKGPSHGGAATAAKRMVEKVGSADNADSWLHAAAERHEKFMGFGHRVYRTYDPRAKILREMAKTANPEYYPVAARVEEVALEILKEKSPERPNATNVDYWSAAVLDAAGFPTDYFTCVFAASRMVGWSAHVLEYMAKDGRILRPASKWVGPAPRETPSKAAS
ncbi:MAG TPA: citrate/2-methylcitrate synthase [Candidatus Dormibacteraeota bacterium]